MGASNKKQNKVLKGDPFVVIFLILFICILIIAGILFFMRHSDAMILITPQYDVSSECSLSLCDCSCYHTELMPEVLEQKLCANDCRGLYGIESCRLVNETCIPNLIS
jgi:hypothetical protein